MNEPFPTQIVNYLPKSPSKEKSIFFASELLPRESNRIATFKLVLRSNQNMQYSLTLYREINRATDEWQQEENSGTISNAEDAQKIWDSWWSTPKQ
jgi:hypothetical protein